MCDVGANADCKPAYLVQFAQMAIPYAEKVVGITEPKLPCLISAKKKLKARNSHKKPMRFCVNQYQNLWGMQKGAIF